MKNFDQHKFGKASHGLKIGADIVASGIVGTVIGVSLDKMFETKPICLLICLFLSLIASLKLIYHYVKVK